jgi:O-antigen/teichoic acid export membrane protein
MSTRANIAGTTSARIAVAVCNLIIVVINARSFGAEGVGQIAIYLLTLHLGLLLCEWFAGSALVYLASRHAPARLFLLSFFWVSFITLAMGGAYTLNWVQFSETTLLYLLLATLFTQGLNQSLMHICVGTGQLKAFNLLTTTAPMGVLLFIGVLYFSSFQLEIWMYYSILLLMQTLLLPVGLRLLSKQEQRDGSFTAALKQLFSIGFFVQLANVIQFINYRLMYLLIERFLGMASLGIYAIGNQISEAVWMPGRSAAIVHYSHTSNTTQESSIKQTLKMLKYTGLITSMLLFGVFLVPESWFTLLFGSEFAASKPVIVYLLPGIFLFSLSFPISAYFAGNGLQRINAIISGLSLLAMALLGYLLIPGGSIKTACQAVAIVYSLQSMLSIAIFKYKTRTKWREFI